MTDVVHEEAVPVDEEPFDPEKSNLVLHARRELEIAGIPEEDRALILPIIETFASQGHSGGSAQWFIVTIVKLLQFENLTSLTDNPDEWNEVEEGLTWQSARNPEAFSHDRGATHYYLSEITNPRSPEKVHKSTDHIRANRG